MRLTAKHYKYFLPAFLWAVVIAILSLLPGNDLPKVRIPHIDKMVHFTIYLVFGALLMYGFAKQYKGKALRFKPEWIVIGFTALWGTLMEVMQLLFTKTRHFEYLDILTNIIGSILGIVLLKQLFKNKKS